jgi:branched-chain amino acid aminotransferase
MSEPVAYLNGQYLLQSHLAIPFCDAGFVYGATVTDLVRTFHHRLFRLSDHLSRFRQSCNSAHVPLHASDDELADISSRLVAHNSGLLTPEQDLALVMFATPGPVQRYAGGTGGAAGPTLGMHTFPLPFARYLPYIRQGVRLFVPTTVRQLPAECVDPRIKQRSRLHWWLADHEAQQADPGSMALLLDLDGHVTETASSNLAIVRHGAVLTPPRPCVLPGVSMRVVEELCGELGVRFEERPLTLDDCFHAEEAFVTCTSFCLAGVSAINRVPIPWPGKKFQQLLGAWSRHAGVDIQGQILAASP